MASPVDDVQEVDKLLQLEVCEGDSEDVGSNLLLHVLPDTHTAVFQLLLDVGRAQTTCRFTLLLWQWKVGIYM